MKAEIHPNYKVVQVSCACGSQFATRSTINREELKLDVCNACHPFYTGKHKMLDAEGRVEAFMRRYKSYKKPQDGAEEGK